MKYRHLDVAPGTPPEALPSAAIVDLLERGDLDDWRPLAEAVARDPLGPFAQRLLRLIDRFPRYGTAALWRAWIERCRARAEGARTAGHVGTEGRPVTLSVLRRDAGLTQADVAARTGMSQSDVSKFERRRDVRTETLRSYARALGGRLRLEIDLDGRRIPIRLAGRLEA